MEHGHIQGLGQIFGIPPIISGTGKATDFKFGGYIYRANANKSPLKILEKRGRELNFKISSHSQVYPHVVETLAVTPTDRHRRTSRVNFGGN